MKLLDRNQLKKMYQGPFYITPASLEQLYCSPSPWAMSHLSLKVICGCISGLADCCGISRPCYVNLLVHFKEYLHWGETWCGLL